MKEVTPRVTCVYFSSFYPFAHHTNEFLERDITVISSVGQNVKITRYFYLPWFVLPNMSLIHGIIAEEDMDFD